VTPTLSVEPFHARLIDAGVEPVACRLVGVDGAVVSAGGGGGGGGVEVPPPTAVLMSDRIAFELRLRL
jgi:hypothetical protein